MFLHLMCQLYIGTFQLSQAETAAYLKLVIFFGESLQALYQCKSLYPLQNEA